MLPQLVPDQKFIYCKLVPQPSSNNDEKTFLLELLPNNGTVQNGMNVINQNQFNQTNHLILPKLFHPFPNFCCQKNTTNFFQKVRREKVVLDQNALRFKERFYAYFTYRKRIPKDLVFTIHNNIAKEINLRCVTREECRSVNKYFKNFSKFQKEIFAYLSSLTNEERNKLLFKSQCIIGQTGNL